MYHLVGAVDSGGGYECLGAEDTWQISVPSTPFFSEHKTALKKTNLSKKEKERKERRWTERIVKRKIKSSKVYILCPQATMK